MADSSNVTIRSNVNRALSYEEGDANFQELINVIDEFNQFDTDQGVVNNNLQTQIDNRVTITDYNSDLDDQSTLNTDLQNQINTKVNKTSGTSKNLTNEENLYLKDFAGGSDEGVIINVIDGVVDISPNTSESNPVILSIDGAMVWTSENDGDGSGLDADYLGGISHEDYITEAPEDSKQYTRIDGTWQEVQTTQTTWGVIQGTLSDQTDLEDRLVSIENIKFNITTTAIDKTLTHTERCFVTASGITLTLPASPAVGDYVSVGVLGFDDVVVNRNGNNIMGLGEDMTINIKNTSVDLTYVNATLGWRILE